MRTDEATLEAASRRGVLEIKRDLARDQLARRVAADADRVGLTLQPRLGSVLMVVRSPDGSTMAGRHTPREALYVAWCWARCAWKAWRRRPR